MKTTKIQNPQIHPAAKDSIRLEDWCTHCTFGCTFPAGDGTGACDVEVQIGQCGDYWYLRTCCDDAVGSDDCDATPYDTIGAAEAAADDLAAKRDECDGLSAEHWIAKQEESMIEAGKSDDGEYVLAHKDGTRWDNDRYSDMDAAKAAIKAWYDGVQSCNPGTDIIWYLMDCPVLAHMDDAGAIEIVADKE